MQRQIPLFIFIVLLCSSFHRGEDVPEVIRVNYPEFVSFRYSFVDFPEGRLLFDKNGKVVWPYTDNYLTTVDSCCWYKYTGIRYGYDSAVSYTDGKVIETYKRLSQESWLMEKNGIRDTLFENRAQIVNIDTIQVENYENPGAYFIHIVSYYSVRRR